MNLSIVTSELQPDRGDGAHPNPSPRLPPRPLVVPRRRESARGHQQLSAAQAQAIASAQCARAGTAFERPRVIDAGRGLWLVDMGALARFKLPAMSRRDWYGWLEHFYDIDVA